MANSQAMYTGNFGFDLTFGSDVRVVVGLYTGPVFFQMGDKASEAESFSLSAETTQILTTAAENGVSVPSAAEIENAYNDAFGNELDQLNDVSFGWNLARGRLQVEYKLFPLAYIGIGGQYAYHYTFSGSSASAGIKDEAINQLAASPELESVPVEIRTQLVDQLKLDVGAEPVDTSDASGSNFNAGIYFKLEI